MTTGRTALSAAAGLVFMAVLGAAACSAPTPIPDRGRSGRPFSAHVPDVPGIDNFARITPTLCRGGQPDSRGLRYLRDQGFRTVVNLRSHHSERKEAVSLGLRAVEIPLQADVLGSTPPTEGQIREFFQVVLDPACQPVYFHCAHGKDRTGTMAALYRIEVDGWTPEEAVEEMMAFGYHMIYRDLVDFVRGYSPRGYGRLR